MSYAEPLEPKLARFKLGDWAEVFSFVSFNRCRFLRAVLSLQKNRKENRVPMSPSLPYLQIPLLLTINNLHSCATFITMMIQYVCISINSSL